MKIKAFAACNDNGDGSTSVSIYATRQEALDSLGRTEEQLEKGCYYEDGTIIDTEIEITDDFKLAAPIHITDIE